MVNDKTALIIFSRTPRVEAGYKSIFNGDATSNLKMWDYLYNKTLRIAHETKLPLIICDENAQKGESFGEKISYALFSAFGDGYNNLIVIGGDCPNLSKAMLLKANRQINGQHDVVLGPDTRGGVYLFAINKSVFEKTAFTNFGWQTRQLCKQFKQYTSVFSVVTLSRLADINTKENVITSLFTFLSSNSWRTLLSQIIITNNALYNSSINLYESLCLNSNKPLRAPPLF